MRTSRKWQLKLALILTGFAGTLGTAEAQAPEGNASLTVQVTDYAQVGAETLAEAEGLAVAIFLKAGVQTRWVNMSAISQRSSAKPAGFDLNTSPYAQIHILSQEMASRLGMSDNVMGLAPGKGPDRRLVYVFYEYVKKLAQRQVLEHVRGNVDVPRYATAAHILGEMMTHELGHILLNLPSHSKTGIMRGDWDLKDLYDVAYGYLLFTPQQAEVIRADVTRRSSQSDQAAEIGSLASERIAPE